MLAMIGCILLKSLPPARRDPRPVRAKATCSSSSVAKMSCSRAAGSRVGQVVNALLLKKWDQKISRFYSVKTHTSVFNSSTSLFTLNRLSLLCPSVSSRDLSNLLASLAASMLVMVADPAKPTADGAAVEDPPSCG